MPFYPAFLHKIKLSGYKMGIKLDKDSLAVEQNYYLTKYVNVYIVYDLDVSPKIPLRSFTLKNCLFEATNLIKNDDKEKYAYCGYGIVFAGKREWNFCYGFARNVIFFRVHNSLSFHAKSIKNNFLVLGDGDASGVNESSCTPEKKFSINFSKT